MEKVSKTITTMWTNVTAFELLVTIFLLLLHQGKCGGSRSYAYDQVPDFTEPLKNITVQMGRNATFTCHVNGILNTPYRVSWVKADTRAIQAIGSHKITQNPRIRVMQEKRVKHHLIIINATLEEDGPYMCQLNTPSMKSQIGFLTVYKKADIIKVTGADGIVEGGEARLNCEAEGYPKPTVYWTRAEKDLPIILKDRNGGNKREVYQVKNSTLVLSKISRSQMGNYLCIATNDYSAKVSYNIMLNVNFRPVIIVETPMVYARRNQNEPIILECLIEAYPQGVHFWEHDRAGIINEIDGKYSIAQYDFGQYRTRLQLTIHEFSVDDLGMYKCICNNPISSRVEGDVQIVLEPEKQEPPSTTTETEYYINAYTDFGDYMQPQFHEYQEGGMHRSKGSTTFVIKGRTPPTYDISINSRNDNRKPYSKGGSSNIYYSTTNNGKENRNHEDLRSRKKWRNRKRQQQKGRLNAKQTHGEQISNEEINSYIGINTANRLGMPISKINISLTSSKSLLHSFVLVITYLTASLV